jgi:hypothetical protein
MTLKTGFIVYVSCNTNTVIKCESNWWSENIVKKQKKNYESSISENICCCLNEFNFDRWKSYKFQQRRNM